MKKLVDWFKESDRWKHLLGGYAIGVGSDDVYCAIYAGGLVGCAMEYKDKAWGGDWDWIDAVLTLLGSILGFGTKIVVKWIVL